MSELSRGISYIDADETKLKYETPSNPSSRLLPPQLVHTEPSNRKLDVTGTAAEKSWAAVEKRDDAASGESYEYSPLEPSAPEAETSFNQSVSRHRKAVRRKEDEQGDISPSEKKKDISNFAEHDDTPEHKDEIVYKAEDQDYQRPAKLDLIVGFLRFFNFLSASSAVFGIVLSLYLPLSESEDDILKIRSRLSEEQQQTLGYTKGWNQTPETYRWILYIKTVAGAIQLGYLLVTAVLVTVDSIATMTFRWKEYGELTHRHTDATSILFLLSKSRWKMRLVASLTIASSLSLHTTHIILRFYGRSLEDKRFRSKGIPLDQIPNLGFHAVIWYIALIFSGIIAFLTGYLLHFVPPRFRDVPWLDNYTVEEHVDDKGDIWVSRRDVALAKIQHISKLVDNTIPDYLHKELSTGEDYYHRKYKRLTTLGKIFETINKGIYFVCYICSIAFNLQALILMDLDWKSFEFWTVILSSSASVSISGYLVFLVVLQTCRTRSSATPALSRLLVPFLLSSGIRQLLDLSQSYRDTQSFVVIYIFLMALFILSQLFALATKRWSYEETLDYFFLHFFSFNFCRAESAYKKVVRLLDTLGSLFALIGLVIGLCSLFIDQYDLEFEPMGELRSLVDGFKQFSGGIRAVEEFLKNVIKEFDFEVTCEHIYTSIATGTLAGIFLSLVPGAGSAAAIGSKTASFTVRVGSALSKLAKLLKATTKKLWEIQKIIRRVSSLTIGAFKTFTIGGASVTLLKLLPFLPPVVIGVYTMFSAFWPQRILFFSAKQRRKFINGQFLQWLLSLVLLVLALSINTALVDELVRVFDDALPLVKVLLVKRLGWQLSLAASTAGITAALCFFTAFLILMFKTDKNHDNLTNEELDWKNELEKRQLVCFSTAYGPKIEKRNQIRYKKERIGPWTWVLPIVLCLVACGFGLLANLYPKIDMYREPKGAFGRAIEEIFTKINFFEDDMSRVRDYGERECLPWQTFGDAFSETLHQRSNILMNPINTFFNRTEQIFQPLRQVVARTRKQLIADIGDDLFGQDVLQTVKTLQLLDLQYLGMLLLIPRAINLLILIFGMFTMSIATCRMIICECVEPRKLVNAFGAVTTFSVVYVLGTQLALFNVLEEFGIPFYRITVRFGLGFIYDLVCDSIMISIYIGMKNEFFFAIPKRKVVVTYAVPGASDEGPNITGQVI